MNVIPLLQQNMIKFASVYFIIFTSVKKDILFTGTTDRQGDGLHINVKKFCETFAYTADKRCFSRSS